MASSFPLPKEICLFLLHKFRRWEKSKKGLANLSSDAGKEREEREMSTTPGDVSGAADGGGGGGAPDFQEKLGREGEEEEESEIEKRALIAPLLPLSSFFSLPSHTSSSSPQISPPSLHRRGRKEAYLTRRWRRRRRRRRRERHNTAKY